MNECLFCKVDGLELSEEERRGAYFALGSAGETCPPPCATHANAVVLGLAVIGDICDQGEAAGRLRELVRGATS